MVMSVGTLQMFEVSSCERSVWVGEPISKYKYLQNIYTLTDCPPSDFQLFALTNQYWSSSQFTVRGIFSILILVSDPHMQSFTENI